uniref:Putative secreted protein n=1 Tax=Anopheles darlingi TaxID=43151 RepID=A0A2M4D0H0_ANODA
MGWWLWWHVHGPVGWWRRRCLMCMRWWWRRCRCLMRMYGRLWWRWQCGRLILHLHHHHHRRMLRQWRLW